MVFVVGIIREKIDWCQPFRLSLIIWELVLCFMVLLRIASFYVYVETFSCFWGISIYSNSTTTVFRHYGTVNITLALLHFSWLLCNSFRLSQINFSTNHYWKASAQSKRKSYMWHVKHKLQALLDGIRRDWE